MSKWEISTDINEVDNFIEYDICEYFGKKNVLGSKWHNSLCKLYVVKLGLYALINIIIKSIGNNKTELEVRFKLKEWVEKKSGTLMVIGSFVILYIFFIIFATLFTSLILGYSDDSLFQQLASKLSIPIIICVGSLLPIPLLKQILLRFETSVNDKIRKRFLGRVKIKEGTLKVKESKEESLFFIPKISVLILISGISFLLKLHFIYLLLVVIIGVLYFFKRKLTGDSLIERNVAIINKTRTALSGIAFHYLSFLLTGIVIAYFTILLCDFNVPTLPNSSKVMENAITKYKSLNLDYGQIKIPQKIESSFSVIKSEGVAKNKHGALKLIFSVLAIVFIFRIVTIYLSYLKKLLRAKKRR